MALASPITVASCPSEEANVPSCPVRCSEIAFWSNTRVSTMPR
jgi:hypothetical protein